MAVSGSYTTALAGTTPHPYLLHQCHQPHQLLCRYRSKVCAQLRAYKRDGSLHRYCEEHRQRANTNQKTWVRRRMQAVDAGDFYAVPIGCELQYQYQYQSQQELVWFSAAVSVPRGNTCDGGTAVPTAPIDVDPAADSSIASSLVIDSDALRLLEELDGDWLWSALGLDDPVDQRDVATGAL